MIELNFLFDKEKVVTYNIKSNQRKDLLSKEIWSDVVAAKEQNFLVCPKQLRLQGPNKSRIALLSW